MQKIRSDRDKRSNVISRVNFRCADQGCPVRFGASFVLKDPKNPDLGRQWHLSTLVAPHHNHTPSRILRAPVEAIKLKRDSPVNKSMSDEAEKLIKAAFSNSTLPFSPAFFRAWRKPIVNRDFRKIFSVFLSLMHIDIPRRKIQGLAKDLFDIDIEAKALSNIKYNMKQGKKGESSVGKLVAFLQKEGCFVRLDVDDDNCLVRIAWAHPQQTVRAMLGWVRLELTETLTASVTSVLTLAIVGLLQKVRRRRRHGYDVPHERLQHDPCRVCRYQRVAPGS